MAKQSTPVADPEPTAPPTPDPAQVPPVSRAPEPAQPESGDGQPTTEPGADPLAVLTEVLKDPAQVNRLLQMIPEAVRDETDVIKDVRGRGEQRGRRLAFNDMEARSKDLQATEDAKRNRAQAFKDLGTEDIDATTRSRHANAIQTATEAVHDGERKEESWGILKRAASYEDYGDEDHDRITAVDGKPWAQWFREHITVALAVQERRAYARGLAEGQKGLATEQALRESVATAAGRPGAPAVTPGGAPAPGGSDADRVGRIASGDGTQEDADWFNEKYRGQRPAPRGA